MLAILVLIQTVPAPNEAGLFLIKVALIIVGAIVSGLAALFKTQSDRRYREFNKLRDQTVENTSAIKENTIYDKNRNDKFKDHEERMKESEKSLKDFLTEYKRESKADWKDFKREVKDEISALRKEIHNKK